MDYPFIDWPDEGNLPPGTWICYRTHTTSRPLDDRDPPPQSYDGSELPPGAVLHFRTRTTSRPRQ